MGKKYCIYAFLEWNECQKKLEGLFIRVQDFCYIGLKVRYVKRNKVEYSGNVFLKNV